MTITSSRRRSANCLYCGKDLPLKPRGRQRLYCSDLCRGRAWTGVTLLTVACCGCGVPIKVSEREQRRASRFRCGSPACKREYIRLYMAERRQLRRSQLGATLRSERKRLGLNQTMLATMLGIKPPSISRWESNLEYPAAHHLEKLAAIGIRVTAT